MRPQTRWRQLPSPTVRRQAHRPSAAQPRWGRRWAADTSGIADADGLANAAFSYQWLAGDSDISGATGSAYTLADADEGKIVKVRVSFTDDGGNDENSDQRGHGGGGE